MGRPKSTKVPLKKRIASVLPASYPQILERLPNEKPESLRKTLQRMKKSGTVQLANGIYTEVEPFDADRYLDEVFGA